MMYKQNSMAIENQASTDIHDSIKSYSSRFNKLKALKDKKFNTKAQVLPYKIQRAVITIQRFYRFRLSMRRRLYDNLINELIEYNKIVKYQNDRLDQLISIYQSECSALQKISEHKINLKRESMNRESNLVLKDLARTTFKMQQKACPPQLYNNLYAQYQQIKQQIDQLEFQKQHLQYKLSVEYQQQQEKYLKTITQETGKLLKMSKARNQKDNQMRTRFLSMQKQNLKL